MTYWQTALLIYALVAGFVTFITFIAYAENDVGAPQHIIPRALFWPVWLVRWIARGTVDLWRNG